MPLPRVCVLCAISGLGGAEFSLLELVARLRDSYEFHLIVPGEGPSERESRVGRREGMDSALAGSHRRHRRNSARRARCECFGRRLA